jgi:hypothetical protein
MNLPCLTIEIHNTFFIFVHSFRGGPLVLGKPEGGPLTPVVQVGIASWAYGCADHRYPSVFTRISDVAEWVKDTVCARTAELCTHSKSGKNSKTKKVYDECIKVPTFAPLPTYSPTITAQPYTLWLTYPPTITAQPYTHWPTYSYTNWPTWIPTACKFHFYSISQLMLRMRPVANVTSFDYFSTNGKIWQVVLVLLND